MTGHAFSALPIFVIFLAIGWVASVPLQARVSSMQQGEYGVPSYLARYMADRGALLQNLDAADGSLSRQARALRSKPQSNTVTDNKPASSTQAQVYDFDGIDHGAMGGLDNDQPLRRRYARALYGRKRNIDEIDSSSFDSFFKRNLDEIDRVGWNSFVKRVEELTDRMDQY